MRTAGAPSLAETLAIADCKSGDIGDVAGEVEGWMETAGCEVFDECVGGSLGEIEEGYPGALQGE